MKKVNEKIDHESNRIITVLVVLSIFFIALIVYLTYIEVFAADSIQNNSYNKRLWMDEEYTLRGSIYDRDGNVLAYSSQDGEKQNRHYNYGSLYSHIIGYSNRTLGKEGLEKNYNKELLNTNGSSSLNEIRKIMAQNDFQQRGKDLVLTIDHDLQAYAKELLGNQKGSIVAMNPTNGEIYAMVSYPNFDPNAINENWDSITDNPDAPLVNRATQGQYVPGSIFKVITAASALENQNINTDFVCEGQVTINGEPLKDYNGTAHGSVDLHQAFVDSCNVSFGQIATELGQNSLEQTAEKFILNQSIPFDIDTKKTVFSTSKISQNALAWTGVGQGDTLVSPLNMAMMTSAIANEGKMMKPILVKEVVSADGDNSTSQESQVLSTSVSPGVADTITSMMIDVVNSGTGRNAALSKAQVAGKTGTAEVNGQKSHAWFVGFAPASEPKVAVAVVLENHGSTGGSSAAPIARNIISRTLELID